jgi:hypothetical protein
LPMTSRPVTPGRQDRTTRLWAAALIPLLLVGGCNLLPLDHPARPSGSVAGRMIIEGGPFPHDGPRPIRGRVRFFFGGKDVDTVKVGKSGKFTAALAPGTYRVRGCTPDIQGVSANGAHTDACMTVRAMVRAGRRTHVKLLFIVP